MNRRIVGLIVAILLAAGATFLLVQYVTTADERAREAEELAEVFVAQGDINPGTTADDAIAQGLIATDEIPARAVPDGAIGSLSQIEGLVAAAPVYQGEVIVSQRFGETVAQPEGVLDVPEGLEAITVEAGIIDGVAGFVQPDDAVSVVATLTLPEEDVDEDEVDDPDAEATAGGTRTEYLVQDAHVLAVGQRVVTTAEDGTRQSSIELSNERYIFTLGLTPEAIEQLVFAWQQGTLHFTLLPQLDEDEEREPIDTPGRSIVDIFED